MTLAYVRVPAVPWHNLAKGSRMSHRVRWFLAFAIASLNACAQVREPQAGSAAPVAGSTGPRASGVPLSAAGSPAPAARTPIEGPMFAVDPVVPVQPVQPNANGGPLRSICQNGRCVCLDPAGSCQGRCVDIADDAGSCDIDPSEQPSGCAASGCPNIVAITAGDFHTCVLLADRTVMCWGMNTLGENNSSIAEKTDPQIFASLSDVVILTAGRAHSCATLASGVWS
jgi:hypothetical protein